MPSIIGRVTDLETTLAPHRPGPSWRRAAPALLGYAAVRALGLAALAVWSATADKSAHQLLSARWDSLWYTRIAELGYGYEVRLPNGDVHSNLAFFPLLPWLERAVSAVSPLSYADAGLLVTAVASVAAAWGIFAVADHVYGEGEARGAAQEARWRETGGSPAVLAVLVWAVLPVGIVQSMAYSESLFTALAAWSLYAVLTGRWLTAGLLASLAGLTRPVGMAVVAAVWVTVFASFVRERSVPVREGAPRWRRAVAVLIAPLGAVGYVLWVGRRTGDGPTGYLTVQAGWRNGFDGGYAFARFVAGRFTSWPSALAGVALVVGVCLLLRLCVACVRQRQPLPLLVYAGAVTLLALCASSYFGSKPRLLMPAFPLLLPLAVALARLRTSRSAWVLGVLAVASAAYGAFWLNGSGPP